MAVSMHCSNSLPIPADFSLQYNWEKITVSSSIYQPTTLRIWLVFTIILTCSNNGLAYIFSYRLLSSEWQEAESLFRVYYVWRMERPPDNRKLLTQLRRYKHITCCIFTPDQEIYRAPILADFYFYFWLKKTWKCSITVMFGMNNDILIALIFVWAVIF